MELIYPTSVFCWKVDTEIEDYFAEINNVFTGEKRRELIILNGFKNTGNLLLGFAEFDRCFEKWGGSCPGRVLGQAMHSLLNPNAQEIYDNLNLHSLHGDHS